MARAILALDLDNANASFAVLSNEHGSWLDVIQAYAEREPEVQPIGRAHVSGLALTLAVKAPELSPSDGRGSRSNPNHLQAHEVAVRDVNLGRLRGSEYSRPNVAALEPVRATLTIALLHVARVGPNRSLHRRGP